MQFTQVKKILKVYTSKKTNTNSSQLNRERAYLSEIFLELEGISDLAENYYNIYGTTACCNRDAGTERQGSVKHVNNPRRRRFRKRPAL